MSCLVCVCQSKNVTPGNDSSIRLSVLMKCRSVLNEGIPISDVIWDEQEKPIVNELRLLSAKPLAYVCNVDEASAQHGNAYSDRVKGWVRDRNRTSISPSINHLKFHRVPRQCLHISCQLEADAIAGFDTDEARREFLQVNYHIVSISQCGDNTASR